MIVVAGAFGFPPFWAEEGMSELEKDMLAALEACEAMLSRLGYESGQTYRIVAAAIAKAKGE